MSAKVAPFDVLLACSGSIAAYKTIVLLRLLVARGLVVQPVVTRSALHFVGAETLSALSGRACLSEMFGSAGAEPHVELAASGAKFVLAPATADVLARLAQGRSDDLLTATALCWPSPLYLAPAMHPTMWANPATQRNVEQLRRDGHVFLGPVDGLVASGERGMGRMLEPEAIAEALTSQRPWLGRRIIVTAGPTYEAIDPVRFIGNRSSGKMGFAIAAAAARRGAQVELIAGPVHLATPPGVTRSDVHTALEMQSALQRAVATPPDAIVMAAAVGDFRPSSPLTHKAPRADGLKLELVENPDLIAELARGLGSPRPVLVGFALETGTDDAVVARAQQKLKRKGLDLVVANPASEAFEGDTNRVHLVAPDSVDSRPTLAKTQVADILLDWIETRWKT